MSLQGAQKYDLNDIVDFTRVMTLPKEEYQKAVRAHPKQDVFKQFVIEVVQIAKERGIKNSEAIAIISNREALYARHAAIENQSRAYLNLTSSSLANKLGNVSYSSGPQYIPVPASGNGIKYRK